MSILLSLYTKDGITYAADKNLTEYDPESGKQVVYEGDLTKVFMWPKKKAVVGFAGLATLDAIPMDDWLRYIVAETRDFDDLADVARLLQKRVQTAYAGSMAAKHKIPLIIHLGGFETVDGIDTPMLHLISNVPGLDNKGGYLPGEPQFDLSEQVRKKYKGFENPSKYPSEVRQRFSEMEHRGRFLWFNNGHSYEHFNSLKSGLFTALSAIRQESEGSQTPLTLTDWEVYAKMAVELFGMYFKYTRPSDERVVGGGVKVVSIRWPESNT